MRAATIDPLPRAAQASAIVRVRYLIDPSIEESDIIFSNSQPVVGDTVVISATVHNLGEADANSVVVEFFDSEAGAIFQTTVVAIPAAGTTLVEASWVAVAPPHERTIGVHLVGGGGERTLSNNLAVRNLTVGAATGISEQQPPQSADPAVGSPQEPELSLSHNRPNPFNPTTTITFSIPWRQRVVMTIYSADGRIIRELLNATLAPGTHGIMWDGRNSDGMVMSSGVYFYRLQAGESSLTGRMVLVR
jgi:hypothetical protein